MGSVLKRARRTTNTFWQESLESFVRELRDFLPPAAAAACDEAADGIECWRHHPTGLWVYAAAVSHPDPRDASAANEPPRFPYVVHRTLCFVGNAARDLRLVRASTGFGMGAKRLERVDAGASPHAVLITWHEDGRRLIDQHVTRHIRRTLQARLAI